ncbi:MAG TPA: hypothetical protein VGM02_10390 [Acidobacteriaceae bacterium]|jgi:hypothetical protein
MPKEFHFILGQQSDDCVALHFTVEAESPQDAVSRANDLLLGSRSGLDVDIFTEGFFGLRIYFGKKMKVTEDNICESFPV